ncbi:MAG TPA: hypothetical protein VNZ22_16070 [Bacillota bacterium]|nr:hypothetical protein [Bacillota bacterium]
MQVPIRTSIASTWAFGLALAIATVSNVAAQEGLIPSPAPSSNPPQAATTPTKIYLSAWLSELLKLAQAGIDENILLTFIDAAGTFNLTSDQIIYLRDLGVSNVVINALIQHDWELATGVRQMPSSTVPPLAPAPLTAFVANTPPPGPTPSPALPPAGSLTGAPIPAPTPEAMSSEAAEAEFAATEEGNGLEPLEEPLPRPAQPLTLTPVRAPYPERLTAPIIVIRAAGRMPNMTLLESFP